LGVFSVYDAWIIHQEIDNGHHRCTLAFFVNILRVVGTGVLANYYGSQVARGFLHEFSGIAVFLVGFFLFFLIHRLIEEKDDLLTQ